MSVNDRTRSTMLDTGTVIHEVERLLATEIFSSAEATGPLFRAAYSWLVLAVHDLLAESDRRGLAVAVGAAVLDRTQPVEAGYLIGRARHVVVHRAGGARMRQGSKEADFAVKIGEASGYGDDIAVVSGGVELLIRRHLVRAFEAARTVLTPDREPLDLGDYLTVTTDPGVGP
ncbi:MAG: hypothetical protein ACRYFW_00805 [Janthinobacterium lividum]